MTTLKKLASRLPDGWQVELKRIHYGSQIRKGIFLTDEPEYKILETLIAPGDWVIDIGANVGHYTKRLSEIVGEHGRVIAFEPVPTTFSLLSANVQKFKIPNVSLFNAGVSDKSETAHISMPSFSTGLDNYYQAHISADSESNLPVLTLPLDTFDFPRSIALVKIDAEGHEEFVLRGMRRLIKTCRPVLIIETSSRTIIEELQASGYSSTKLENSPNLLFKPN
ncbi:unnamed protein product, partial [Ectocarpus sp. 12 AP-2014]